ncbi:MAG: DUF1178 family protein [Rhodospirillaceae bacterium]|jgi:hypothetical protein|nr:DUF1178 family protein [Rhodospirillaceae bacterium]
MIVFDLNCSNDHPFEGWFKDAAEFASQRRRKLVVCPVCGDTKVDRALSAPNVNRGASRGTAAAKTPAVAAKAPKKAVAGDGPTPEAVKAAMLQLRSYVEKNADYVGEKFPEEARKIHKGEADARGIYGEASDDEAEALQEEGVAVQRIPWVRHDS